MREVTLSFFGFEKRVKVLPTTHRLRFPACLHPHFPDVEFLDFTQDPENPDRFPLSAVHRVGERR